LKAEALQEGCTQSVPKAVNRSGFYNKHNCPQRDSIPGPRTLQSGMLPLVRQPNDASIPAFKLGYWHQWADERLANSPQGNQEHLMVKDKVGELGVSNSIEILLWSVKHCFLTRFIA